MEKEKKIFPPKEEEPKAIETPEDLRTWAERLILGVNQKGETAISEASQRMEEFEDSDEFEETKQEVVVIQRRIEELIRETRGLIEELQR